MSTQLTEGLLEGVDYGRGFFETIPGVQPGAGLPYDLPQAFQYITVPLFITVHLAASAHAANRQLVVQYLDGNNVIYSQAAAPTVVIANGASTAWFAHDRGSSYAVTNGDQYVQLPHDYLRPEYTLRVTCTNIDTADQLSAIVLGVDRLPVGPRGYQLGRVDYTAGRRALALSPRRR